MSNTPSLEGATCVSSDSAVVSPLQSLESSRVTSLPCPERPEDRLSLTVGAPEGLPQPGGVLPTLPGVPSPAFPRVGDLTVRRSPQLIPLLQQVLHRMDCLWLHIDQHQRMLDYSRQDLQGLGHLMKNVMEVSGIYWEDLGLGHQCGGKH